MTTATSIDPAEAQKIAWAAAKSADRLRSYSRRGLGTIEVEPHGRPGWFDFYDCRPECRKMGRVRQRMEAAGVRVLAESFCPTKGSKAGRTSVLLFDLRGCEFGSPELDRLNEILSRLWEPA